MGVDEVASDVIAQSISVVTLEECAAVVEEAALDKGKEPGTAIRVIAF